MNGSNFTMGWTGVVVYSGAYQTGVDGRILEDDHTSGVQDGSGLSWESYF